MDLRKTETWNNCADEGQQQFNRPKRSSLKRIYRPTDQSESEAVVRRSPAIKYVKMEAEEATALEAVTRRQPGKI
jgi:hypothetical protein